MQAAQGLGCVQAPLTQGCIDSFLGQSCLLTLGCKHALLTIVGEAMRDGLAARHVLFMGKSGFPDWSLRDLALEQDCFCHQQPA